MQDVRQSIIEFPETYRYSCYHLEHSGQRVNDFVQISEVETLKAGSEIQLVEDPYTEKEARIHVIRVRELVGAAADRIDTSHGILSGSTLHESLPGPEIQVNGSTARSPNALASYDFQALGHLSTLIPEYSKPQQTIKSLSVSPWNPPPYHLRHKGHLLYLTLITNEGDQYHITSHVSGFYVNKCSHSKFDPFPRAAPKAHASHSLLTLINELSLSFGANFQRLLDSNSTKEPLASVQITNAIPSSPWAVQPPSSVALAHQSDITRTQESYLLSGAESTETLRDWNEEFQSTRELPKDGVQDRVFRERLTSKLFADYTDAASRGAVLVARGEVAPLNPTESKDAQIFVYNNIFFSFGADGVGTFGSEGGDDAARCATGKDVLGIKMVNQLDIDGLFTPGTAVVDYLGKRIVAQSIVPGIFKQRDPDENQIDYGAVEGKDVIAANEKFVYIFQKLSKALKVKPHAVWDKSGKRWDLEGSLETKGLLSTDGRKYVLDLYRITPLDIAWMEEHGTALNRETRRSDGNSPAYPHRMTVLRPELVESYWKLKLRDWVDEQLEEKKVEREVSKETEDGEAKAQAGELTNGTHATDSSNDTPPETSIENTNLVEGKESRIDMSDFEFALNPDVFCGQEPQEEVDKEQWRADEQEVRRACEYLRSKVIKEFVHDLEEGDLGFPMDGQSLSRLLHKRGINVRYIGRLAGLAAGKKLEALRVLTIQEMISRAFKHIASKYLKRLPIPMTGSCIAHLLNCLLGTSLNPSPKAEVDESMASLYHDSQLDFQDVMPTSLKEEIEYQVLLRYRYTLEDDWISSIKHLQLLREISLELGLQLEAKDYCFSMPLASKPVVTQSINGTAKEGSTNDHGPSSKKKKAQDGSPASFTSATNSPAVTFSPDNLLNVVPVVKEASPRSLLAEEALEAGKVSIVSEQKKLGQELLLESLSLHEQIYGLLHPEVARIYNSLSMIYFQLEERDAAIELARKAVVVSERTLGLDHTETLLNYLNLSLITHACGESRQAILYVRHALDLWKIIYGPNHPDSITTINNAAVMFQNLKEYHESRVWFEASLSICSDIYGRNSINAATLLFQLAQALALDNEAKAAVSHMRESYNVFLAELGPNDKNTKEAEKWLEQLTQNAVNLAKQANMQARTGNLRVTPRNVVSLGQGNMRRATAGGVVGGSMGAGSPSLAERGLDKRSIDELIRFIEGSEAKKSPGPRKKAGRSSNPKRRGGAAGVVGK